MSKLSKRKTGTRYCASIGCNNCRISSRQLSFFKFPTDPERCKQWILNTRRADLEGKSSDYCNKSLSICALHFEDDQFMNAQLRNKLVWNAIPTLFTFPKSASTSRKRKILQEEDNLNTNRKDMRMVRCYVRNCKSISTPESDLTFHEIPQTPEIRNRWMVAIGRSDWNKTAGPWDYFVCSKHFRPREISTKGNVPKVKNNVVPSIFERNSPPGGHNDDRARLDMPTNVEVEIVLEESENNSECNEVSYRVSYEESDNQLRRRVKELEAKVNKYEKQLKALTEDHGMASFSKLVNKATVNDPSAMFLLDQVNNFSKNNARWSDLTLRSCLDLRDTSPEVYERLQTLKLFKLPCISTLVSFSDALREDSKLQSFIIEYAQVENGTQNGV